VLGSLYAVRAIVDALLRGRYAVTNVELKPDAFEALQREVASLKAMAAVREIQGAARSKTQAGADAPAAPATNTAAAPRHRLTSEQRREALTEALEERWVAEAVDPSWSPRHVALIKTNLSTAMPDVQVVSASCLTSLCKVVVQHAGSDSQDSFMERASTMEGMDTPAYFFFDHEATPPRTVVYLARAGQKLPSPAL
jgi:hypothetical protein